MSEFHDDLTVETDNDSDLVRQLRKQLRDKGKEAADAAKELATYRAKERTTSIGDLLKDQGVNPKIARLLPADIEPTEDAVKGWLDDYADVFNIERGVDDAESAAETAGNGAQTDQAAGGVSPEARAAFEAAQRTEASGGVTPLLGVEQALAVLKDAKGKGSDEALKALRAAGLAGG